MNKTYRESDGFRAEDLLQSAFHHYKAAEFVMGEHPFLLDSGGYLLHLATELLFKSWLLHSNKEFSGTHKLQQLRNNVCSLESKLKFTKQQNKIIDHLSSLYELRYSKRDYPTGVGQEDLVMTKEIFEKVYEHLPEGLIRKFEEIPLASKGGRILMKRSRDIPLDFDVILSK